LALKSRHFNNTTSQTRRSEPTPGPESRDLEPSDRGIRDIAQLERNYQQTRSFVDRMATSITRKAGSGAALVIHVVWFLLWIAANLGLFDLQPFDPYPFSLLTTIVSLEAIFLTLFVLIAQNRMSHEADRRAELDLQVNLLAEREDTMILRILHDISLHLGLKGTATKDLAELLKETRVDELSHKLDSALPSEDS
jgi:uncharacterized membrane protein